MTYIAALILGTLYGLIIGIIPSAGATTGLVILFPALMYLQMADPYLAVVFIMSMIAASTTGDTFASVLLGIPGANSSAATMVDGFPLAQQGKASYALSAAITTSTINGLIFGSLTFLLLPFYQNFLLLPAHEGGIGQAELFTFCLLAFVSVTLVSNKYWFRASIALALGVFLALVGVDPSSADPRFTLGWDFLQGDGTGKGISLIPLMAGLFAMPELINAWRNQSLIHKSTFEDNYLIDGIKISFKEWKLGLRGGAIGAFVGFLPGIGGAISDWIAYGQAVASNPKETFGNGNIKGVIGPEGANNAQKATSMIPTLLFGIPGAPFAVIVLGLFAAIGFDLSLDNSALMADGQFLSSIAVGFLAGTVLTGIICLAFVKQISKLTYIPYKYYFPVIVALIVWATYTAGFGLYGWQNVFLLCVFTSIGLSMKKWSFSRPALMIGFILGDKIEQLFIQTLHLFNIGGYPLIKLKELFGYHVGNMHIILANTPENNLLRHPVFIIMIVLIVLVLWWSYRNKSKINYS